MADVQAFRGFRYDLGRVGSLGDVVAPPYDVIDPALQDALYQRSPFNVVRLILNKEGSADTETDNRYTRSAQTLNTWLQDRILVQDSARSLYVYHQQFDIDGRSHTRKGFMARVRLQPYGAGDIYPHEETQAGPRSDRLKLFRATAMNLSQVFSVYPDPGGEVQAVLENAVGRALPLQAVDHVGVVNKLWPVTDQHAVSTVVGLMGLRPLFIADGHHRYETALKYQEERKSVGETKNVDAPANFVLMHLVSAQDAGLLVLPTHRLISGLGPIRSGELRAALAEHFDLETLGEGQLAAQAAWETMEIDGTQELLAFGTSADGIWQLARFKSSGLMEKLATGHSADWRSLAVAVLHKVVIERLLPSAGRANATCTYVHTLGEVVSANTSGSCELAALVPPVAMGLVEKIASSGEKMPSKSTYFYPKVLSGLVFHSLKP